MFDLVPRPDRYGDNPPEPTTVDELIQARIDGRLSRREMIRKALQVGIAAPVVGVMLHATSDMAKGAPTQKPESRTVDFQSAKTVPADKPTKPAGEPKEGGTLTIATNEEPDTLHPWLTQLVTASDLTVGIADALLLYDSTEKMIPGLATEFSVSKDGLNYSFTLRDGVTFHNGDKFTADDVINSWKMIMNPDFGAFNTNGWDKVTDIKVDGNTLTMVTKEVYAPFLSYVGPTS
ncbi:MAG TPA: ABC transporter substrate-binding protein, partial [Thermomicrobiales bacterium]|nr:ABC transporter substrate-binding protein [Thermomicrobiales bacterium]